MRRPVWLYAIGKVIVLALAVVNSLSMLATAGPQSFPMA
ncbi:hypothetical protein AB395_00005032 (plasmid) [Sinorhizobium fredii CCBAU 45436]|nr:hypothetical protein AB395_00005032 [Sinorhizobium fredii CCBAU 45436]